MDIGSLVRENKFFLTLHAILFLLGSYPLWVVDNVTLLLQLNRYHSPFLDYFFYYAAFFGSSTMYALLMATLVVMKFNNRTLLIGISGFVVMSVVVQFMKRIVFFDQLRPISLLPPDAFLHLVEGIVPDTHWSLPSGHAATIFTAVCFIHLLMPRKSVWCSVLLLSGAVVVAYARVYLCQHFYRDIYVGAWVGTWTTIVVYSVLINWQGPSTWLDKPARAWVAHYLARLVPRDKN
jgi:membrane-associated phospholipid phosphatase